MAKKQRPTLAPSTFSGKLNKPQLGNSTVQDNKQWGVSFKFFKQIQYFGLGEQNPKWFVSLIERLTQLNGIPKDTFMKGTNYIKASRYHRIDWGHKNIPIQRSEFTWVDKFILENEEDFPFYQFQISKSLGRVVGFWNNEHNLFHIVLLDPAHNIQPAGGAYNYTVNETTELACEYTTMTNALQSIIHEYSVHETFREIIKKLNQLPNAYQDRKLISLSLDEDYANELKARIGDRSIREVLEMGIIGLVN